MNNSSSQVIHGPGQHRALVVEWISIGIIARLTDHDAVHVHIEGATNGLVAEHVERDRCAYRMISVFYPLLEEVLQTFEE